MRKNFWVRLGKNEGGATAIEFSLLAVPFVYVLVGILELSLMFTSASLLESATSTASRQIRIGAIQKLGETPAEQETMFREALCDTASILIDCDDVAIEVVSIGSFSGYGDFDAQFDEDGNLESQGFNAGGVNDVILIRSFYRYRFMTPLMGYLLAGSGGGSIPFMSTIVLKTEPYEFIDAEE